MILEAMLPALIAFFVAAASPGPATLALAATAMSRGLRPGMAFATGLAVGLALWGIVAAAGLGALMQTSAWALVVVRMIGGAYLLYLAWQAARAALSAADETRHLLGGNLFRRGAMLNATNPKAVFAWLAVLSIGLPDGGTPGTLWLMTAACALLGLAIYLSYAMAFSRPAMMAGYASGRRWIEALAALVFGLVGFRLITVRGETP
ncbi:MAG: LysE family translocator [Pseudomonadota bacterium]